MEHRHNKDQQLKISNHHGNLKNQNNLKDTKAIIERYGGEIDIYEVDFVHDRGKIISSHDYEEGKIAMGSSLRRWIKLIIIQNQKVLWIDVKENLAIFISCGYGKFSTSALYDTLNGERKKIMDRGGIDIKPYIWIGCQEPDLHEDLFHARDGWTVILDMPRVTNYILQYIPCIPKSYLRDKVCDESRHSDYRNYDVITIDQSFFFSVGEIKKFIWSLKLDSNTKIVINSFERSVEPIEMKNHYIIMQYNYRV
jgi:hypothetical protein